MNNNFIPTMIPKRKDRFALFNTFFYVAFGLFLLILLILYFRGIVVKNVTFYLVTVGGILAAKEIYQNWALNNEWRKFAETSGLKFARVKSNGIPIFKIPQIEGTYQGYSLKIKKFSISVGEDTKRYTSIEIYLRENNTNDMVISANTWSSNIKRSLFGAGKKFEFIQLDDEAFDRKLEIKSESRKFAKDILSSSSFRQKLMEIQSQASEMKITVSDKKIKYLEKNLIMDSGYLFAVTSFLLEFARDVERFGAEVNNGR